MKRRKITTSYIKQHLLSKDRGLSRKDVEDQFLKNLDTKVFSGEIDVFDFIRRKIYKTDTFLCYLMDKSHRLETLIFSMIAEGRSFLNASPSENALVCKEAMNVVVRYMRAGDHEKAAGILSGLLCHPNIKACVVLQDYMSWIVELGRLSVENSILLRYEELFYPMASELSKRISGEEAERVVISLDDVLHMLSAFGGEFVIRHKDLYQMDFRVSEKPRLKMLSNTVDGLDNIMGTVPGEMFAKLDQCDRKLHVYMDMFIAGDGYFPIDRIGHGSLFLAIKIAEHLAVNYHDNPDRKLLLTERVLSIIDDSITRNKFISMLPKSLKAMMDAKGNQLKDVRMNQQGGEAACL